LIWLAALLISVGCGLLRRDPSAVPPSDANLGGSITTSNMPPIVIVNAEGQATDKQGRPISEAGLRRIAPLNYVIPSRTVNKEVFMGSQ